MNNIKATGKENKVIYVYHHPESEEHMGWLKIGDQTGFNSSRVKDQNKADNYFHGSRLFLHYQTQ